MAIAKRRQCFYWAEADRNLHAAMALYFDAYNFVRPHKSLSGATPATAHGIEKTFWAIEDLLRYSIVQQLYCFQAPWVSGKDSAPNVRKGSREWIEGYIQLNEFIDLFGGYVTWRPPDTPSDQMTGEGLGVWGKRNIS